MKRRSLVLSAIILLAAFATALPWAYSENYGQLRALKHRAGIVMRQKNDLSPGCSIPIISLINLPTRELLHDYRSGLSGRM